ncbi:uncharacterized protein DDB_G0287625-like isoform X2 [Triticum dicoccoides]|uniref:Uncharacterized protein n=2 Tax=Triticum turgidum subsp. durum TaxID=4567 RepID=A0A9R0RG47_TRITD|nr:uncharacterized protein DDB_G0287625-like isoform X2 [Triticum dicoccoides]VAH59012.1 unnamed protein product [Triticum turgidum subsp. durum]
MPRSTRRRSRKHDREERDRSDSDEDPRPREHEDWKAAAVRASKGSEDHEKRPAKLSNAGEASGSSADGQKKRKSRGEKDNATGDDRWSYGEEDERVGYHDSKKSRSSDGDEKGKSARKSSKEYDRANEVAGRKSDKEALLLEEHTSGEHHRVKERGRELEPEKSKESKQVLTLKEDSTDQQHKIVKDRSKDHEKGSERRHDASLKATPRNKEVKTRDLDSDKTKNYSNGGTDDRHREDELHDGESEKNGRHRKTKEQSAAKDELQSSSKGRQTMPRDARTKTDGCYEQQHTDEKLKDDMPRGVEKHREEKYRDDRSKAQDRHKSNKHKDDRHKDEELHRDERYKEERLRHEDRHRDVKYKGERTKEEDRYKDERYKDKPRDEEKPRNERSDNSSREKHRDEEKSRNERSDNSSREKHRDDLYRYHRSQDGGSWDVRSSKDSTRDRSLEKHCKEEHNYSESRHNKSRLHDSKGKKRSYEESGHNGDLEPRNAKEYHGDAKRRSDVSSFVSNEDRRREYEKVDSRRRDFERKSPTRSSTYPVKEQSRHFPKQEESSPRENGAALGRHRRTSDFQSVEGLSKTDANSNESSLPLKDGRNLRSDGRPIHFNDRPPSASDCQVSNRSNLRHNHDAVDGSVKKGNTRHHELLLNRQATEKNYQSASPGHLHLPRDRPEMDNQRSFDDDNRSQIRERRSSSRPRRSGTVDNARGHGSTWNNPPSWPSPVPSGFGPFQHGPPIPGFHPAIHQFPQSLFGMRPSMDTNHAGMHYPLHGHPESFPHCVQPFPWHNPAEDPYISQVPGWDASRSVFEEYSHSYGQNNDPDFQQQLESEVPLSSHTSDKPSLMQLPAQNQSQSSEVKTVEANAEKTDAHAPKYRSEATPGPSIVKVDSRFCSKYFKRLDISTSLASPELYKKCSTMAGELELAGCESTMRRCLKNNKDEHGHQAQGFKYMIKSIFSGETTSVFENAMKLYSSSTGSRKSKALASSSQPESEEMIKEASVDVVVGKNVAAGEDQALPCTDDMRDEVDNNGQSHHAVVSSMPGLAKNCSKTGEDKVGSDVEDKSLSINHAEGLHVPSNGEGKLLPPKALQPCCSSVGSVSDVPKEQFSGVISDATFASGSQSCEDVMPGCRVNFNRIPCSPGST